jgi:recombination protein RecT
MWKQAGISSASIAHDADGFNVPTQRSRKADQQNEGKVIMSSNALEKHAENRVVQSIAVHKNTITAILGKEIDERRWLRLILGELRRRWLRLILGELRRNPSLAECSPDSIVNAVLLAASMKVEIAPGRSYLIPYGREATLIIDYRQKVDIARRSGLVRAVYADVVCEFDEFDLHIDSLAEVVHFSHRPALLRRKSGRLQPVERGSVVLAYGVAAYTDGDMPQFAAMPQFATMTRQDLDAIKSRMTGNMRNPERSPWITHEEEMQKKSVLRRLCKLLPQEESLALSQQVDDSVEAGAGAPQLIEVDPGQQPINPDGSVEQQEKAAEEKIKRLRKARQKTEPKPEPPPTAELEAQVKAMEEAFKNPVEQLPSEDEGAIPNGTIVFRKLTETTGDYRRWNDETKEWALLEKWTAPAEADIEQEPSTEEMPAKEPPLRFGQRRKS